MRCAAAQGGVIQVTQITNSARQPNGVHPPFSKNDAGAGESYCSAGIVRLFAEGCPVAGKMRKRRDLK